jgi:hypothetical protein
LPKNQKWVTARVVPPQASPQSVELNRTPFLSSDELQGSGHIDDYLELVDSMGRCIHPKKSGYIPDTTPAILTRLDIDAETFIEHANHFLKEFGSAVGTPEKLVELAAARQCRSLRGISMARTVFEGRKMAIEESRIQLDYKVSNNPKQN